MDGAGAAEALEEELLDVDVAEEDAEEEVEVAMDDEVVVVVVETAAVLLYMVRRLPPPHSWYWFPLQSILQSDCEEAGADPAPSELPQ